MLNSIKHFIHMESPICEDYNLLADDDIKSLFIDDYDIDNESLENIFESIDVNNSSFEKIIEFNTITNNMEYIIPNNGNIITRISKKDYYEKYKYLSPTEFKKYNGGICWDYCLYQSYYFSKNFPDVKCKFFYHIIDNDATHTFMIFEYDRNYFWYESSWKRKCGIYEFKSEKDAVNYVVNLLQNDVMTNTYKPIGFITEYDPKRIKIGSSCQEFMDYMKTKNLRQISPNKNIKPVKTYKGTIHFNNKNLSNLQFQNDMLNTWGNYGFLKSNGIMPDFNNIGNDQIMNPPFL